MANADPKRAQGERVAELLEALESMPAAEHETYLARACPEDPELRREVLSLLAVEPKSTGYLDRFVGFVEGLAPQRPAPPDLTGKRIGAYRLLRLLGRGGMGVVYEAERADGAFEQRVALKLLTTALAGTEAHERFLAERRILAGLKHPAIAHIVDGGVTEDGTPWFAMEHAEGEPIDAYCDRRRLGIRERLELFLQVCDAVEHAHRRLVVHRDLKPANVLVTEDAQVKLLDFGIARLLEPDEAAETAPPTRTALRLMTPEYASPEQVRGEPVTTASDVYQLGLVLYELLSGHRPYALRRRSASEIEHVVCEQAPTRLSAAIVREDTIKMATRPAETNSAGAGSVVEEVCHSRRSTPARLRRRLRGDLENVVAKALSKEPERRYGSADRLAEDIRRHLDGLPVTARSDTWIYRGRKFLERHALGASAAALVLVLVAGLTGFYTVRIQSESDRAEAQRDRAQVEAAKAQQMSEFLAGMIRSVDPREAQGAEVTVREALDRGVEQVDRELAGQPEVQADMLHVLGRTYRALGIYASAKDLLSRALELRRRRLGPDHPAVAETLRELGVFWYEQGDSERSREQLEEAKRILEASLGGDTRELAATLRALGNSFMGLGELEKGLAAFKRALSIESQASGRDSESVGIIHVSLGGMFFQMGDLEQAEYHYERGLAIHERELEADHPLVGHALRALADTRMFLGKLDGLEAMYRRGLAIQRKAYGPDHFEVGIVLNNLGNLLLVSGRADEAVDVLQEAVDVYVTALGPKNSRVAYPLDSLGDAHLAGGRLREAQSYYQRSVTLRENVVGGRHFDFQLVDSLVGLGRVTAELGNPVAAERSFGRALALTNQAGEPADPRLAPSYLHLGRWHVEQQRCAEAMPLLRRVVQIQSTQARPLHPPAGEAESLLAACSEEPSTPTATDGSA